MSDEENIASGGMIFQESECSKSAKQRQKRCKNISKNKKHILENMDLKKDDVNRDSGYTASADMRAEKGKKKRKPEEIALMEEHNLMVMVEEKKKNKKKNKEQLSDGFNKNEQETEGGEDACMEEINPRAEQKEREEEEGRSVKQILDGEGEQLKDKKIDLEDLNVGSINEGANGVKPKKKKKHKLLKEAAKADKRGICYLSRIPPHMDHVKLRQILSQYGEIQRIYIALGDPTAQVYHKKSGRLQKQEFSEGWVEFTNKNVAKRVANLLNGEQIGGRKRSQFYFDLWNIKYLSKFKWDDLTEEIAQKVATHKQKLALEFSAAKRERDFYLARVDQSRALSSIEERLKKKQKVEEGSGAEPSVNKLAPKIIGQFPQTKPVADKAEESKPKLSKNVLVGVFGS